MIRRSVRAFCLLAVAAYSAGAQHPASDSVRIEAGTQTWPGPFIRAHRVDGSVRAGRLARVTTDSLAIRDAAGRPIAEPRALVSALVLRDRQRMRGAARGAVYGLATAVAVVGAGYIADRSTEGEGWVLIGAIGIAAPLPAIGAGIGFVFAPTRWRPAYAR